MDKIQIFEDTLKQCETNPILISAVKNSIKNTVLYKQGETPEIQAKSGNCKITVTQERTFESAKNLLEKYQGAKAGVLNFASARNVGGGVVRGASAQEECLCRCSTLYPCLDTEYLFENYYQMHRSLKPLTYTDNLYLYTRYCSYKIRYKLPRKSTRKRVVQRGRTNLPCSECFHYQNC